MNIFEHIAQMKPIIARHDWDGLESSYCKYCTELAGEGQTSKISALDFPSYQAVLDGYFAQAVRQAQENKAKAIYFEYDLDNDWQSTFFICEEYNPEIEEEDDWACDWIIDLDGPAFPSASVVYLENYFDGTPMAKGSTLYLIARTVAAFGRCFDKYPSGDLAVCIAFHDQDPIMRLGECG